MRQLLKQHLLSLPLVRLHPNARQALRLCGHLLQNRGFLLGLLLRWLLRLHGCLLSICSLLLGIHGLLLMFHCLLLMLHCLPHIMVCIQTLKTKGKFIIITIISLWHMNGTKKRWWKLRHPEIVKPMNHEQETPVLKMQRFMNGRKCNHLVVRRFTNKWRWTRNTMKMYIVFTSLTSGFSMHLQTSGIYVLNSISDVRMDMILIPTLIMMNQTIQWNLSPSWHLLHCLPMDIVESEDSSVAPTHSPDPLKTMSLVYSYIPWSSADNVPSTFNWNGILRFLGFVHNLDTLNAPEPEKSAMIKFFCAAVSSDGANGIKTGFDKLLPNTFFNKALDSVLFCCLHAPPGSWL